MNDQTSTLKFTGERFLPNEAGEMWAEHWHRYHYVLPLVASKRVLDVACGEGYGSALMSTVAQNVVGIDLAHEAIAHAKHVYNERKNLSFFEASCLSLPYGNASFDVVVSFETIEHITEHAQFLDEIKRVLRPDGLLILSSPNKAEYSDARGYSNPFHVKELYREELAALIESRFAHRHWLSQRNGFYSIITPLIPTNSPIGAGFDTALGAEFGATPKPAGETITLRKTEPETQTLPLAPLYFIVLASNSADEINALTSRTSAFTDAEEWAMKDYYMAYREWRAETKRRMTLESENLELKRQNGMLTLDLARLGITKKF
jgi:SAM-dependent methyltransferase